MKLSDLQPHPLASVFPLMPEEELAALARDIKANGLQEPIVLHENLVIDGRNRLEACMLAGVQPRFIRYDPEKHGSVEGFILSKNIHRRQMSKSQVACVAHLMAMAVSETSDISYTQALGNIIADMGVSKRYVDLASEVRQKDAHFFEAIYEGGASLYDWEKHKASTKSKSQERPDGPVVYESHPDWGLLEGTKGKIVLEGDDAYFECKHEGRVTRCSLTNSSRSTEAT